MINIVIAGAKRTALGAFQGQFSSVTAPQLGSKVIESLLPSIPPVDGVIMGCVLSAGLGQAPARQAALGAGLSVPATTINKVCGSGMEAIMIANDLIKAGSAQTIIAGGMESMTNAPYLLERARSGYRLGHGRLADHMFLDGLEDAYDKGCAMGVFADRTAEKYGFSREEQDAFALNSLEKAIASQSFMEKEIIGGLQDEPPTRVKKEKIPLLKPAFSPQGTVTAASSSSIADGAAALVIMNESLATPALTRAYIRGCSTHAHAPEWFTTAPIEAIKKLLTKLSWTAEDVDLFEINEAFAVVTMAAIRELSLDPSKVNVHGGACALGHPIGASGARIVVTLLHALEARNLKRGIAALCIGGGEATAIALERP